VVDTAAVKEVTVPSWSTTKNNTIYCDIINEKNLDRAQVFVFKENMLKPIE